MLACQPLLNRHAVHGSFLPVRLMDIDQEFVLHRARLVWQLRHLAEEDFISRHL